MISGGNAAEGPDGIRRGWGRAWQRHRRPAKAAKCPAGLSWRSSTTVMRILAAPCGCPDRPPPGRGHRGDGDCLGSPGDQGETGTAPAARRGPHPPASESRGRGRCQKVRSRGVEPGLEVRGQKPVEEMLSRFPADREASRLVGSGTQAALDRFADRHILLAPRCRREEILEACRIARVDEFAEAFEHQYGTLVGERGVKLSGGQRQRVSIARAILADPRILILDEATSSLDSESEAMIQEGLSYLMNGRTTIVIAHRLSTIRPAGATSSASSGLPRTFLPPPARARESLPPRGTGPAPGASSAPCGWRELSR